MQIAQANSTPQEGKQSESVLQWISERTNWLMIFDGADGHYQIVEKFLPPGKGGNILITSRNVGLKRISLTSLKVLNMAEGEATTLLLKSASLDGMSGSNIDFARRLASELGGIPLALDQAGAYMLTSECGIADYLELYTKHKHELMSNPEFKGASDYDRTTYGTWDISMQRIEDMAAKDGDQALAAQYAIRILRIFAFLDHANIPEELFKNAAKNYMKRDDDKKAKSKFPLSIRLLDHETLFLSGDGVWEKMKFLAGIQALISLSFIEAHSQLYSMHILVHAWNRNRIPKAEATHLCQTARALLSCSIDLDYGIDNYVFCKLLAPHVRENALHASELESKKTYFEDEYERFTLVFHHVGNWDEVETLVLETSHVMMTVLGVNHPKTLWSMSHLAATYSNQGRWDEAEKLEVDVMNRRKAKLGSNHPDTIRSMANWADTCRDQGRWDEAEKLEVDVMKGRKAKLGSNHLDTLNSMANLAATYWNQGRWDEAEKLEVDVMDGTKAKLGSNHPDTLTSMANLAATYRKQGRWDEAEKLEVDVMNGRKAKLGSNHPDTLTSMANLASTYWKQRRWDEAEKLDVDVINERKSKLGSNHPDTLTSMANLAATYRNQGRWDEAEKLDVDVMNGRKAKLGSNHPDTLTSMANLAATYRNQGRWDEAEKLDVDVVTTRYGLLHYANLIRRTGPICFLFQPT
jgi:tetratricopeptide (TPR) repeat protein